MHIKPRQGLAGEELDREWVKLINEAKNAGLTVKEVRKFLNKKTYLEKDTFLDYKAAE
jgi:DNA-binding transcriptional MerR regulator